jgi:hypothetical protein
MDRSLIEAYASKGPQWSGAIKGMTREQLRARPVPGKWTSAELVLHMMDSDLIASDRMKRIAAENKPLIMGYDEQAFSDNLRYNDQDAHAAAEIFRLNREMTATLLRALPDEAFEREGVHSERGLITLRGLVELYVWHSDHHLKFLEDKKRALGVK